MLVVSGPFLNDDAPYNVRTRMFQHPSQSEMVCRISAFIGVGTARQTPECATKLKIPLPLLADLDTDDARTMSEHAI